MKIGLIGFCCHSGLGELNQQLSTHLNINHWLVIQHRVFKTHKPQGVPFSIYNPKNMLPLKRFVQTHDIIIFAETPYYDNLISYCKKFNTKSVCIAMQEWLPIGRWTNDVDLFLCPTMHCYDLYKDELPCTYFPWWIDTQKFKYTPHTVCNSFLFINGRGGWHQRKGSQVIRDAKRIWPEMPLFIRSIKPLSIDGTTMLTFENDNSKIYTHGDVLLAPHSMDGVGLELLEAMSCGMPVISTDGEPWNEYPSIRKIQSSKTNRRTSRNVDWYQPNAQNLVKQCKELLHKDISDHSHYVYQWAMSRSVNDNKNKLLQILQEVLL